MSNSTTITSSIRLDAHWFARVVWSLLFATLWFAAAPRAEADVFGEPATLITDDSDPNDILTSPKDGLSTVTMWGNSIVVGRPGNYLDDEHIGAVYVFDKDASGQWVQSARLLVDDFRSVPSGPLGYHGTFGVAVAGDQIGEVLLVGHPGGYGFENNLGIVQVFGRRPDGSIYEMFCTGRSISSPDSSTDELVLALGGALALESFQHPTGRRSLFVLMGNRDLGWAGQPSGLDPYLRRAEIWYEENNYPECDDPEEPNFRGLGGTRLLTFLIPDPIPPFTDMYGTAVDLQLTAPSDTTVIRDVHFEYLVGAPQYIPQGATGAGAYDDGYVLLWDKIGKLDPTEYHRFETDVVGNQNGFGVAVLIDGDTVFIGETRYAIPGESAPVDAVHIFRRDAATGAWNRQAKIVEPNPGIQGGDRGFGGSLALYKDMLVVGVGGGEGGQRRLAYLYEENLSTGDWDLRQTFTAPAGHGSGIHNFVATNDSMLIVDNLGAFTLADGSQGGGATFVFEPGQVSSVPTTGPSLSVRLDPAFPNPANPIARVRVHLQSGAQARVAVYDIRGRHVQTLCDEYLEAGATELRWNGSDMAGRRVASGVYHVSLEALGQNRSQSLTLVK